MLYAVDIDFSSYLLQIWKYIIGNWMIFRYSQVEAYIDRCCVFWKNLISSNCWGPSRDQMINCRMILYSAPIIGSSKLPSVSLVSNAYLLMYHQQCVLMIKQSQCCYLYLWTSILYTIYNSIAIYVSYSSKAGKFWMHLYLSLLAINNRNICVSNKHVLDYPCSSLVWCIFILLFNISCSIQ